jgi:prepilin peptidase CpaA
MTQSSIWTCILVVLASVIADITTRKIPNIITIGGFFVALAIHTALGILDGGAMGALRGFGFALGGAAACGTLPFLAWRKGEMGGGDVKLFAAIGALMGPTLGFDVQATTFTLAFLVLFPYRLLRHRALGAALVNVSIGLRNVMRRPEARVAYVSGPKLPPVILAPTIGVAFFFTLVQHGGLYGVLR